MCSRSDWAKIKESAGLVPFGGMRGESGHAFSSLSVLPAP